MPSKYYCPLCGIIVHAAGRLPVGQFPTTSLSWHEELRVVRSTNRVYVSGVGFLSEAGHVTASSDYHTPFTKAEEYETCPPLAYPRHPRLQSSNSSWAFAVHNACWDILIQSLSHVSDDAAIIAQHLFSILLSTQFDSQHRYRFGPGHDWQGAGEFQKFNNDDSLYLPDSDPMSYMNENPSPEMLDTINFDIPSPGAREYDWSSSTTSEYGDACFSRLPLEVVYLILEWLPSVDVGNLRLASRTIAHLATAGLLPTSFWLSRFIFPFEMQFAFPRSPELIAKTKWKNRYFSIRHALRSPLIFPSVRNRKRIWDLVRPISGLIRLLLDNGHMHGICLDKDNIPQSLGSPVPTASSIRYNILTQVSQAPHNTPLYDGCRELEVKGMQWAHPRMLSGGYTLGISTISFNGYIYICGMRLFSADRTLPPQEGPSLGLINKACETLISVKPTNPLVGFDVVARESGICGLRPCFEGLPIDDGASFVGDTGDGGPDTAIGRLRLPTGKVHAIAAGFDACKMTSFELIPDHYSRSEHIEKPSSSGLDPSGIDLWTPRMPQNASLQMISPISDQPFKPILNMDFGGTNGSSITSLTRIVVIGQRFRCPFVGMEFFYSDGTSTLYGRRGTVEQSFIIDGPEGEIIAEVKVAYVKTHAFTPKIRSIEMITNWGNRMTCNAGEQPDRSYFRESLVATAPEIIVGFIAVMGVEFGEFRTFGIQTQNINALQTHFCAENPARKQRIPPDPSIDIGSDLGTIRTQASLINVCRIRFSSGLESRPRRPSDLSGVWIEYHDAKADSIIGQWFSECDSFTFLEGERVTGICLWMSKEDTDPDEHPVFNHLIGLDLSTSQGRSFSYDHHWPVESAMKLRFRENPHEVLDSILWGFNTFRDYVRVISRPSHGSAGLTMWSPPYLPRGPIYEKAFWNNGSQSAPDRLACIKVYSETSAIVGLECIYDSGKVAPIGRTEDASQHGSVEMRELALESLEVYLGAGGTKEITFHLVSNDTQKITPPDETPDGATPQPAAKATSHHFAAYSPDEPRAPYYNKYEGLVSGSPVMRQGNTVSQAPKGQRTSTVSEHVVCRGLWGWGYDELRMVGVIIEGRQG